MSRGYQDRILRAGAAAAFLALAAILVLAGISQSSLAQTAPSNDLLNQLQQQLGNQSPTGAPAFTGTNQNLPSAVTLQPVSPNAQPPLPPSRLEEIMSARAGARLQQFGYDQLGRGTAVTIPQTGAVQDDYVLGPGDEIVVSLRGQENGEFRAAVDRNGQVVLPRLNPIPAIGRTFGNFRQDIEAAIRRAYIATNASISVGRVRQISVLVSGEVNSPGQRLVTGLSSVVDALLLSGGIRKTGSLRNVRIQRGGHEFAVDLYNILTTEGTSSSFRLADGDRILVPPLGKTVAVTGLIRQPGIYELAPHQSSISARNLLALAGGQEVRGNFRLSVMHIGEEGQNDLTTLASEAGAIRDSEILFVELGADQMASRAMLSGGVGLAGAYPVVAGTKLSDVLKAPGALGNTPYTLFGIISRRDPRTLLRTLVPFTPVAVLNGGENQTLQSDDVIRPITLKEARLVTSTIQSFLQQRNQDEQALLNPLSTISNAQPSAIVSTGTTPGATTPSTTIQSGPGSTLTEKSSRSSGELAQDEESEIQLIGNFTQRQLDMVAGGQVKVSDFRYLPERTQNLEAQGVYLPLSADPEAAQSAAISAQALQQNSPAGVPFNQYGQGLPDQYGLGLPVPMQGAPFGQNGFSTQQNNGYYGQFNRSPAPNFQEEPSMSGTFPSNLEAPTFNALAQQLGVDPLVLVNFIIDHQVTLDGAVRGPGSYFVGPGASLKDLVEAAGGTINWADNSGVELISTAVDTNSGRSVTQRVQLPLQQGLLASYIVKPHDGFRFNQVFNDGNIGNVTVQGEVRYTGNYRVTRGEHLSDLLTQAGGLTTTAYPYGTIFLRKSAADSERQGYIRAANEVEDQLVVAMTRIGNDKIEATTFASMQTFVNQLRTQPAVGRVSVTADPSVLAAKPELDPLLEPGDVVYVPQRPSTIAVLGQVSQPGNFPYRSGLTMADYISQAGGYSATSDESMTFIVLPDGSARKAQNSWLSFDSQSVPPGTTIVVPRDVTPLDARQVILDISSIFSQLAVSAASLAVLATVK
jgi:polysaccharide export outer membrane protein